MSVFEGKNVWRLLFKRYIYVYQGMEIMLMLFLFSLFSLAKCLWINNIISYKEPVSSDYEIISLTFAVSTQLKKKLATNFLGKSNNSPKKNQLEHNINMARVADLSLDTS